MDLLFLTKTGGILKPFAIVLGWIINYIYIFLEKIGIPNIGLAIILFTLIVNIILLPMTIKQQKYTKLSAIMNPELQKIQAKYKGKRDEVSMRRMQAETQAVYQKYGTSTMGGCLYMLIQMPILFALYQVIYKIPAYVDSVYALYETIAQPILNNPNGMALANELMQNLNMAAVPQFTQESFTVNKIIDMLYNVKTSGWESFVTTFNLSGVAQESIATINRINSFIGGLNIADPPMANGWFPGILIPILSGFTQWLSVKLMQAQTNTNNNNQDNPMAGSMKMMNTIMPLFSVVICFTIQTGLGIYWIASAVFRTIISVIVNKILEKEGVDAIIEKNKEKAKKKAEKRGDKPSRFEEYAKQSTRNIEIAEAAARKRKSISELANTSVDGSLSAGKKENEKKNEKKNSSNVNEGKDADKLSVGVVKDEVDDRNPKYPKKQEKPANIAAYANMLKKK